MFRRHEIWMGAAGLARRQFQHLRMERGDDDRDILCRWAPSINRALEPRQILLHETIRLTVAVAAVANRRLMADTNPQHKASAPYLSDRICRRAHRQRIADPDIRDSGGERQAFGMAEEISGMGAGVASAATLRHPQRPIAAP